MSISDFLVQSGLSEFVAVFEENHISLVDLPDITDNDLADTFGMSRFADRKRFRAAAAKVGEAHAVAPVARSAPSAPSLAGATRVAPSGATPIPSLAGATRIEPAAALPQQLGSYRVLGLLGTGGMGTVVRARHVEEGWAQQQGGDVAIKLIHPQIATDPEFRSRFMSEAALGRKVQHPGFVPTFDVISEGAWLGTVMSFVTGDSLGSKVVPGGLSVDAVIALLAPIGEALDYLHGLGIVHRDLKPANIVVQPNGRPVVLDLGIAKDMQSGGNHTRTMTTMGTSAWMAPEQADAKHVDGAADRYAFGMIAYVLLSGQMPWSESTSEARVFSNKLMGQLVPLEQVCAGVPQHVAAAVMKMVSLEAGDRYSTCVGFVQALRVDEGAARAAEAAAKLQAEVEAAAVLKAKQVAEGAAVLKAKQEAEAAAKRKAEAEAAAVLKAKQEAEAASALKAKVEAEAAAVLKMEAEAAAKLRAEADAEASVRINPEVKAADADLLVVFGREEDRAASDRLTATFQGSVSGGDADALQAKYDADVVEVSRLPISTPMHGTPRQQRQYSVPYGFETERSVGGLFGFFETKNRNWESGVVEFLMAVVPPCSFTMGAPVGEAGRDLKESGYKVGLSREFEIGKTPVTQALWVSVMEGNPSEFTAGVEAPDRPVEQVSWYDAVRFCNALSRKLGLDVAYKIGDGADPTVTCDFSSSGFRLPTEAEWECAARAGTAHCYAGDDTLENVGWFRDNSHQMTHHVGQKQANAWGLWDMTGNVLEWTQDWFGEYVSVCALNPTGPAKGSHRVLRGGSWYYAADVARVAYRFHVGPGRRASYFGLRLARTVV